METQVKDQVKKMLEANTSEGYQMTFRLMLSEYVNSVAFSELSPTDKANTMDNILDIYTLLGTLK